MVDYNKLSNQQIWCNGSVEIQQTSNNVHHPEDKLDIEIKEMTLMLEESQKMFIKHRKSKDANKLLKTEQVYINKAGGKLQHKVWKPRR